MISGRSAKYLLYTTTAFYTIFLVVLTHLPLDAVIAVNVQEQTRLMWGDKVIHGVLYTFLTFLYLLCSRPIHHDPVTGDLVILPDKFMAMTIIVMLIGLLDEITQPWFGRSMELLDLAADFVAIFPGACLFLLSHIIRQSVGMTRM